MWNGIPAVPDRAETYAQAGCGENTACLNEWGGMENPTGCMRLASLAEPSGEQRKTGFVNGFVTGLKTGLKNGLEKWSKNGRKMVEK